MSFEAKLTQQTFGTLNTIGNEIIYATRGLTG